MNLSMKMNSNPGLAIVSQFRKYEEEYWTQRNKKWDDQKYIWESIIYFRLIFERIPNKHDVNLK